MRFLTLISAIVIILASCQSNTKKESTEKDKDFDRLMGEMHSKTKALQAEVLEFEDAGSYTYVKLKEGDNEFWAAITRRPVELGKTYYFAQGMMMKDFHSKELDKTFDEVMFIQEFSSEPLTKKAPMQQGKQHDHTKTDKKESISVEAADGGITIEELFKNKADYNGKKVIVRGEVVKINANIMSRNWIHIQDGSGYNGHFDLTVTTTSPVNFKVGDVVTFEGVISVDKDFGSGYKYDVIMEKAQTSGGKV